jgi:erythromycin esterase
MDLKTVLRVCAIILLLAGCAPATPAAELPTATLTPKPTLTATPETLVIPPEAANWLQQNAILFAIAEPGNGCDDLQPLLDMIGNARVVALGEATHGTHEFFTMKHRILECLVEEKGFTIYAMEEGWAEMNHINAYVQGTEDANPADTLSYFMGSSEIDNLIEWMRQYNDGLTSSTMLSLHGFDMQYADLIMQDLLSYMSKADPVNRSAVQENLDCFKSNVINWSANPNAKLYSQAGTDIQSQCRQGLQNIHDLFASNQSAYESASSPAKFAEAFQLVNLLTQNEELMRAPTLAESINIRDRYMAENIEWLLNETGPEVKMVISAHNGHVALSSEAQSSDNGESKMIPMGIRLKEMAGDDLVVIGMGFNHGSFRAIGYSNAKGSSLGYSVYKIDSPIQNSQDTFLANANLPRFYLDLRTMRTNPNLADWFLTPRWLNEFGLGYIVDDPKANAAMIVLPNEFDILIYFEQTTASQP